MTAAQDAAGIDPIGALGFAKVAEPASIHPNGAGQLTEEETARYLGVSISLLRKWRRNDEGPPWTKLGRVRYWLRGLDEHLEASTRKPAR